MGTRIGSTGNRRATGRRRRGALALALAAGVLVPAVGTPPAGAVGASVTRLAGEDRYQTAAAISRASFTDPSAVHTVYVATGEDYPDALAAAPAAAKEGAPLLLVRPDGIPPAIATELSRLAPSTIVLVGGPVVLPPSIESALRPGRTVVRVAGANRMETSRLLAARSFGDATTAYLATGWNFPDALSASAAAGAANAPVLLIDGGTEQLDAATRAALVPKGISRVRIVGGPAVVHPGIERSTGIEATGTGDLVDRVFGAFETGRLDRFAGANRVGTSAVINRQSFPDQPIGRAYVASADNFPDALAGAVAAIRDRAPLYVVQGCIPAYVADDLRRWEVDELVVLGGLAAVPASVANQVPCATPPWLARLNQVRTEYGVWPVREDPRRSGDIAAHLHHLNQSGIGLSHDQWGGHPTWSVRGVVGGLSNLASGAPLDTDGWVAAPFHLSHLLSIEANGAGAHIDGTYTGLGLSGVPVGPGVTNPFDVTLTWPKTYPAPGTSLGRHMRRASNEWPDPTHSCGEAYRNAYAGAGVGLPLWVGFDPNGTKVTTADAILTHNAMTVPSCVVTAQSYFGPALDQTQVGKAVLDYDNAVFVVPLYPLVAGGSYQLSVSTNAGNASTHFTVQ